MRESSKSLIVEPMTAAGQDTTKSEVHSINFAVGS